MVKGISRLFHIGSPQAPQSADPLKKGAMGKYSVQSIKSAPPGKSFLIAHLPDRFANSLKTKQLVKRMATAQESYIGRIESLKSKKLDLEKKATDLSEEIDALTQKQETLNELMEEIRNMDKPDGDLGAKAINEWVDVQNKIKTKEKELEKVEKKIDKIEDKMEDASIRFKVKVDTCIRRINTLEKGRGKSFIREALKKLNIPARYIGSRKESIFTKVAKAPFRLLERAACAILGKAKPIKPVGLHNTLQPMTQVEMEENMRFMAAADLFGKGYDDDQILDQDTFRGKGTYEIPKEYRFNHTPLANFDFSDVPGNIMSDFIDNPPGFMDLETGLHFKVLYDGERNEVIVAFCPSAGAISDEDDKEEEFIENDFSDKRYDVAVDQLKGKIPLGYEQASKVVQLIQEKYPESKITTVGHCFGGSMASFAALSNEGVQAKCFNPLPLGPGLQSKIPSSRLKHADDIIYNVTVKGDFTSDPKKGLKILGQAADAIGIRTPGVFGQRKIIPPAREEYDKNKRHNLIANSLQVAAGWRSVKPETSPAPKKEIADIEPKQ